MCTPDFYDERMVTARKPHKCCETGRMIQPGERYWRICGKWEGDFMTFIQSEAAFHFARFVNGVGDRENAGDMRNYDGDACIPFGWIGRDLPDASLEDEWERVKRGVLTRYTTKEAWERHRTSLSVTT